MATDRAIAGKILGKGSNFAAKRVSVVIMVNGDDGRSTNSVPSRFSEFFLL